jgi:hypothetical protein
MRRLQATSIEEVPALPRGRPNEWAETHLRMRPPRQARPATLLTLRPSTTERSVSEHGYIYVKNWDRFQHYKNRRPAWIKLYLDLFNDDEYLDLTPSDRCLLQACWMGAAEYGNGRCRADLSTLRARSKSHKGSLKRLSDAGFIEIRASKALAEVLATEVEVEEEQEVEVLSRELPSHAREEDQPKNGHPCSPFAERMIQAWIRDDIIQRLTVTDRAVVAHAIDLDSVQVRQSMALVEKASNPKAYLMTIARKITA